MSINKEKLNNLSQESGVYIFRNIDKDILYVGKATNLRSRVSSYFSGRDGRATVQKMMNQVFEIETKETDSVLEALILESNLIKKYQPKYNIKEKDDKSFSYFVITKEEFPRVIIKRKTDLVEGNKSAKVKGNSKKVIRYDHIYGPYTSKKQMELALKIIRKIFPFHTRTEKSEKGCLDFQIGLCPGPYEGVISDEDYKKNIHGVRMILDGKKKRLLAGLKREMDQLSRSEEFERAADLRNKVFALEHIQDVSLIGSEEDIVSGKRRLRIEAYDISNISGDFAVGSMVVFDSEKPNRSEYRKFKIKTVEGVDDVSMMREVLERRFKNKWREPHLIIVDGGKGHTNMAEKILVDLKKEIPLIGVAKGPDRKKLEVVRSSFELDKDLEKLVADEKFLKRITDEAHRFAITYHRQLRDKELING
ncbi:GIY-YIG nuclease family protein [Patescibacteria group bacterium]